MDAGDGMKTVTVELDYLAAVQLIEAGDVRIKLFETHLLHGTARLDDVAFAIIETQRGIDAIRKAFRLPSEAELNALNEAIHADLDDLRAADVPLADMAPGELVEVYGK